MHKDKKSTSTTYPIQGRHGEFEPGKVQYSTPIFFWLVVFYKRIETQNLGKDQSLASLAVVAAVKYWQVRLSVPYAP